MTTTTTTSLDLSAARAENERLRAINHELCATVNAFNVQAANTADELRAARALIDELEDANRPAAILVHTNRALIASLTAEPAQEREVFESTLLLTAERSHALEIEVRELRAASTKITDPAALNALRFEVASMIRDECALDQVTEPPGCRSCSVCSRRPTLSRCASCSRPRTSWTRRWRSARSWRLLHLPGRRPCRVDDVRGAVRRPLEPRVGPEPDERALKCRAGLEHVGRVGQQVPEHRPPVLSADSAWTDRRPAELRRGYVYEDVKVVGYQHHAAIKAPVAV